jgi:hypothetical protein
VSVTVHFNKDQSVLCNDDFSLRGSILDSNGIRDTPHIHDQNVGFGRVGSDWKASKLDKGSIVNWVIKACSMARGKLLLVPSVSAKGAMMCAIRVSSGLLVAIGDLKGKRRGPLAD